MPSWRRQGTFYPTFAFGMKYYSVFRTSEILSDHGNEHPGSIQGEKFLT